MSPPSPKRMSRRESMLKSLPSDPNMITPAIRATLPTFQLVQDRERSPESDPPRVITPETASEPEPEPDQYILAPRTYTPVPPTRPTHRQVEEEPRKEPTPPPEIKPRSSLRNRFSLKRNKDASQEPAKAQSPPKAQAPKAASPKAASSSAPSQRYTREAKPRQQLSPVHSDFESRRPPIQTTHSAPQPRTTRTTIVLNPHPNHLRTPLSTPPSRGLDSAYCSDLEKPLSPPGHPALRPHTPTLNDFPMPSPRSGSERQQYFHPVNASPHSPLQRPWTAAPSGHVHTNSNLSNLSNVSSTNSTERAKSRLHYAQNSASHSTLQFQTQTMPRSRQNDYNDSRRENMQSRMGMSMMTVGVDENGKKVKKKRSAFGWLKKAFALDEEERRAFEEKKRMPVEQDQYMQPPEKRWVDGKRVVASPVRSEFSRASNR
jgi:hypothetical protein